MRKSILCASLLLIGQVSFSQPKVYFDFVTHNEETISWDGNTYYNNNRNKLITLANYFQSKGITWNMQSDWRYLTNVITKENPTITTNFKNILIWMQDDKGVEMDPHAHESQYLYPDVVKLMDSIGLTESKLVGGSIYNDSNGINIWTNLSNGQYGKVFPAKFWKPSYMMGGGTPNHVADIKYYGVWNPQSPTNYLTHDTAKHLRHFGVGCSIKIKDTSTVASVVNELKTLVQNVQSGLYPSSGFYLQSIFFEQGDLNNQAFYNKVIEVADSVSAIVATGKAEWKTLKQAYTVWETTYNAQMFQWNCGQTTSLSSVISTGPSLKLYPNPATDRLTIETLNLVERIATFSLYSIQGKLIKEMALDRHKVTIDISDLVPGIYTYNVTTSETSSFGKLLIKD